MNAHPITPSNPPKFPCWIYHDGNCLVSGKAKWTHFGDLSQDYIRDHCTHWSETKPENIERKPTAPTEAPESGQRNDVSDIPEANFSPPTPAVPVGTAISQRMKGLVDGLETSFEYWKERYALIESTLAATESRLKEAEGLIEKAANAGSSGPIRFHEINAYLLGLESRLTAQSEIADGLALALEAARNKLLHLHQNADCNNAEEIKQIDAALARHAEGRKL